MNLAANVFAGASTIASGFATGYNALMVMAIGELNKAAKSCESAL
jgi:hypothetical protein